jgi:hypothetical protein
MFRVLDPHESLIPVERKEDYQQLKERGVMQMSKIYDLVFGGRLLDDGRSGQQSSSRHLTTVLLMTVRFVKVPSR